MKKITFKHIAVVLFTLFSIGLQAQNNAPLWGSISESDVALKGKEFRSTMPNDFSLFSLNTENLKSILEEAPSRNQAFTSNVVIDLPTANGKLEKFRVFEASVLSERLKQKFPGIDSYAAQGIDDPSAIARFSFSKFGFNGVIYSANHASYYIDPYTEDKANYIAYSTASLPASQKSFECLVEDTVEPTIDTPSDVRNADDGMLRTFRLALACTGEYAQFHLNEQGIPSTATDAEKKAAVISAMNVTMTRVNGVYERDLAVTMVLVDNEAIIYLNAGTDPFSNNNSNALINESQTVIDSEIGSANYDIGHTFSTGGGGLASLRVPCTSSKARGITGTSSPIGDFYDIDYVAHEMGHQFGANHTFNNSCGGNRNGATSHEPGSGSTIMAYAGICPPNVQGHSDDYFHGISIQEMWANITTGNSTCGSQSATNNDPPTADAGANFTIPKSTPFILKGTATDPNSGDVLSFCWEQFDRQVAPMPPQNDSNLGPLFRSIDPLTSPNRYMPDISTVLLGGTQSTWEVVPSVTRNINFRFSVRDNVAGGASSASDDMVVSVDGDSGPFVVTSQSGTPGWKQGTQQTITWDVAGTDAAPVNSPTVDIMLSLDGVEYDIILASATANDGSEVITVPNIDNTDEARVMVAGTDHLFYALNADDILIDENLSIDEASIENFSLYPNPTTGIVNLEFTTNTSSKVSVSVYDLRGRKVAGKEFNNQGGTFKETFNYSSLHSGMYFITVENGGRKITSKLLKN